MKQLVFIFFVCGVLSCESGKPIRTPQPYTIIIEQDRYNSFDERFEKETIEHRIKALADVDALDSAIGWYYGTLYAAAVVEKAYKDAYKKNFKRDFPKNKHYQFETVITGIKVIDTAGRDIYIRSPDSTKNRLFTYKAHDIFNGYDKKPRP